MCCRLAHLFLISDVLFNSQQSQVRNTSLWRGEICAFAGTVFRTVGEAARGEGRMTREKVKGEINKVIRAWEEWSVAGPEFIEVRAILSH